MFDLSDNDDAAEGVLDEFGNFVAIERGDADLERPDVLLERKELIEKLNEAMMVLKPRHRNIVEMSFGVNGEQRLTRFHVARLMRTTQRRVRDIVYDALGTLHRSAVPLDDYL